MKWLLWKDYRQNRLIVFAALFFLLAPHLFALYACCEHTYRWGYDPQRWIQNFAISTVYSLIISQLSIALIGGNAIAGERVDRSAEFLALLPITRKRILASKLLLSLAMIAIIWVIDAPALVFLEYWANVMRPEPDALIGTLGYTAITASAFFSVAWLLSSFLSSPTFAVAGGLLSPLLLATGLAFAGYLFQCFEEEWYGDFMKYSYCLICLTLAPLCFAAGTWHYLRRVEP